VTAPRAKLYKGVEMKFDIITVGSAVIDTFVESRIKETRGEMLLPVGKKLLVNHLGFATGGSGANTAVAFSRMGFKTGFLGKVGKDENGEMILKELKKEKVEFLGSISREPTGYSIVIDSKKRDRTILTFRGANEMLSFSELNLKELDTEWFYFSNMNENSFDTEAKLAEWANKHGIKLAFNPGSHIINSRRKDVLKILRYTDILVVNESEAKDLVGRFDEKAFKKIMKLGPKIVAITYGEKGAKVCNELWIYVTKPNKVKVIERTGAGDAFASGLVAAHIKLGDVEAAMKVATLNAESVIQQRGAKVGLLSWHQAVREMDRIKVNKKVFYRES
jgi:ribokinase